MVRESELRDAERVKEERVKHFAINAKREIILHTKSITIVCP